MSHYSASPLIGYEPERRPPNYTAPYRLQEGNHGIVSTPEQTPPLTRQKILVRRKEVVDGGASTMKTSLIPRQTVISGFPSTSYTSTLF